jgi:hypothetical protein
MADAHTCSLCGVTIEQNALGDRVIFSYGPPGTRSKLWSRVCKFVGDRPGCINQDPGSVGTIQPGDEYEPFPEG